VFMVQYFIPIFTICKMRVLNQMNWQGSHYIWSLLWLLQISFPSSS
jgi:hypothetical protein